MGESRHRTVQLHLAASVPFLPVVTQFVETVSGLFGLAKPATLKLALATEEIFIYLCHSVCPGKTLEMTCLDGLYDIRVFFRFPARELNFKGLNVTSALDFKGLNPASADECSGALDQMGLMIASRSVDHLQLTVEKADRVLLGVTKEKTYPRIAGLFSCPEAPQRLTLESPDPERIKRFALLTGHLCADHDLPAFFETPGKVADMVSSGEYQCLTAMDQDREIVGGILFCERSERIIQFFGPYLFHRGEKAATGQALLETLLGKVARTKALGLLSLSGLPKALEFSFEPLGFLSYRVAGRATVERPFFFRLLHEDPGGEVWSPEELKAWLGGEYDRLVLAREIRIVRDMGEKRFGSSLFAVEISRERAEATLRPLWPGADWAANVAGHIRYLWEEGLNNLLFEVDLGIPWHAELIPILMDRGFQPALLLPFAGRADIVVFQHHDATES
ncbi:MAG: hypothetical protein M0009_16450 [Deltaproteobacteria bacterium]|nr:hypothetical protein [Deltaproteobacteria bacterium]